MVIFFFNEENSERVFEVESAHSVVLHCRKLNIHFWTHSSPKEKNKGRCCVTWYTHFIQVGIERDKFKI